MLEVQGFQDNRNLMTEELELSKKVKPFRFLKYL